MDRLEKVERLREKTGVTYEDAMNALEKSEWDMLNAIVDLEREGKIIAPERGNYSTAGEIPTEEEARRRSAGSSNAKHETKKFFSWIKSLVDKGNKNFLNIERRGETLLSLPVTVFIVFLLFAFWGILPIMIISLFFGFRYSFSGRDLGRESVNNVMNKASEVAESIKDELKNSHEQKDENIDLNENKDDL